jgi:hypothetical protein
MCGAASQVQTINSDESCFDAVIDIRRWTSIDKQVSLTALGSVLFNVEEEIVIGNYAGREALRFIS